MYKSGKVSAFHMRSSSRTPDKILSCCLFYCIYFIFVLSFLRKHRVFNCELNAVTSQRDIQLREFIRTVKGGLNITSRGKCCVFFLLYCFRILCHVPIAPHGRVDARVQINGAALRENNERPGSSFSRQIKH